MKILRNAILGLVVGVLVAGAVAGTADAQTGYDGCPAGYSRKAVLYSAMQSGYPGACRLSQCKPYSPPAYAGKVVSCMLIPGLPAAGQGPLCLAWLYQALPAAAPANFCPADVQTGGTTGWLFQ